MNIEEIRARCEDIIESGLLDRERYEDMKEYMSLLESHLDAYWDMYQSASRECDRLTSELEQKNRELESAKVNRDEKLSLAMLAGARAIENYRRLNEGTRYVYDMFSSDSRGIYYAEAAAILRKEAEAALSALEVE